MSPFSSYFLGEVFIESHVGTGREQQLGLGLMVEQGLGIVLYTDMNGSLE